MAATLRDVARETGLSVSTVSKYINGATLKERNRIAIERAIKKLGYTVNEYARGLKSNKSHTIGVVIPILSNLFVTEIITHMEDLLRARGYSVIVCDCHEDEQLECEAVDFLLRKMVDGIINMPVCRDGRHLKPAKEKGIPIVLLDRTIPSQPDIADCVVIDNEGATRTATRLLLENGHRNIGIIVGPADVFTSLHRLKGYQDALTERGVTAAPGLTACSDYTVQGGYESMRHLLETQPDMTAVLVTNSEMTLGAMIAVNDRKLQIPQDLSFIGFDNVSLARAMHPPLTIVTQPLEQIGARAARVMLERLSEQEGAGGADSSITILLSTALQKGDSVQPLSTESR